MLLFVSIQYCVSSKICKRSHLLRRDAKKVKFFFSESTMRFSNFKFRLVIWNIFFLRFDTHITLSEKKLPLDGQGFKIIGEAEKNLSINVLIHGSSQSKTCAQSA